MDNIINQMKSYRVWIQICMQEEKKNIEEKSKVNYKIGDDFLVNIPITGEKVNVSIDL